MDLPGADTPVIQGSCLPYFSKRACTYLGCVPFTSSINAGMLVNFEVHVPGSFERGWCSTTLSQYYESALASIQYVLVSPGILSFGAWYIHG